MFYIAFTKIMVSFTKKLCFIMQSDEDYEKCEQSEFIGWCGLGNLLIASIDGTAASRQVEQPYALVCS